MARLKPCPDTGVDFARPCAKSAQERGVPAIGILRLRQYFALRSIDSAQDDNVIEDDDVIEEDSVIDEDNVIENHNVIETACGQS